MAPPAVSNKKLTPVTEDFWKQAITKNGLNDHPTFSRDNRKILYISRERPKHKQRQLYELNLDNQQEKRLTFQDGDVYEAVMSDEDGAIFYTSTTDAIKERPPLFFPENKSSAWPLTDIYKIRSWREPHERWTDTPSFDGFLHLQNEGAGWYLVSSRLVGDDMQLVRSGTAKSNFENFMVRPGMSYLSFTSSPKRKWRAWVEEDKDSGTGTIVLGAKGQRLMTLKTGLFEVRDVQIIEGGKPKDSLKESVEILYTGRPQKGAYRQAYWLRLKDDCLQSFMPMEANVSDLKLSNDQKLLLWTVSLPDRSQVFLSPLMAPTGSCESLPQ